jgi:hypothetical protein
MQCLKKKIRQNRLEKRVVPLLKQDLQLDKIGQEIMMANGMPSEAILVHLAANKNHSLLIQPRR